MTVSASTIKKMESLPSDNFAIIISLIDKLSSATDDYNMSKSEAVSILRNKLEIADLDIQERGTVSSEEARKKLGVWRKLNIWMLALFEISGTSKESEEYWDD